MTHRLHRLLAAALLGVAAGGVGLAAPAQAAACAAGTGVTVVVDSQVGCDADGGGVAASNFADAGHTLTYAARQPGFVCRVDGAPADAPCVNASPSDAYWGLFWSDGTSGKWTYSSLGVGSLKVPKGGSVAFVFQDSASKTWPSVTPRKAAATQAPTSGSGAKTSTKKTAKPTPKKTTATKGAPATTAPAPTTLATPSASSTPATSSATPSATPTTGGPETSATTEVAAAAEATQAADPKTASAQSESSTAGTWLVAGGVLAVLAAAGGIVWRRRRGA